MAGRPDGTLQVEDGAIADLLAIVLGQSNDGMPPGRARPQWWLRFFNRHRQQLNVPTRARRNVVHHYDLERGQRSQLRLAGE